MVEEIGVTGSIGYERAKGDKPRTKVLAIRLFPHDVWAILALAERLGCPPEAVGRVAVQRLMYDRDPKTYFKLAREYLESPAGQVAYAAMLGAWCGARDDSYMDGKGE